MSMFHSSCNRANTSLLITAHSVDDHRFSSTRFINRIAFSVGVNTICDSSSLAIVVVGGPFAHVATDLVTGETAVLRSGSVIDAVRASISVPGLFSPVLLNSRLLVDGGVSNRVPSDVARSLSPSPTVAVDVGSSQDTWTVTATFARVRWTRLRSFLQEVRDSVNHSPAARAMKVVGLLNEEMPAPHPLGQGNRFSLLKTLLASVDVLEAQLSAQQDSASTADWVIHPDIDHIDAHRFDLARKAIAAGERAAKQFLVCGACQ